MKHERTTEGVRQQASLYALGLLTQHEARCFDIHLEECGVCQAEFSKLLDAAAQIGLAVKEEELPDGFRERLAARIDLCQQTEPDSDSSRESAPEENTPSVAAAAPEPAAARPRSGKSAIIIHTIMYALLAALAAFALYYWLSAEGEKLQLRDRAALSEKNLSDLTDMLRQVESQRKSAVELEKFLETLRKPGMRVAGLKGQPSTPDNTGAVFWDEPAGEITVVGKFAPAPAGRTYHIWFSIPSGRISVGPLPFDENGHIFTTIKFDRDMNAAPSVTAIVTLEPESDSLVRTEPTGPWSATARID